MHFFVFNLDILQIFAFILQIFVLISGFFMVETKKIAKRRDFGSFCSQNHVFLHNNYHYLLVLVLFGTNDELLNTNYQLCQIKVLCKVK
jgi:hypothetical protein